MVLVEQEPRGWAMLVALPRLTQEAVVVEQAL
jgi:hypothetical protein